MYLSNFFAGRIEVSAPEKPPPSFPFFEAAAEAEPDPLPFSSWSPVVDAFLTVSGPGAESLALRRVTGKPFGVVSSTVPLRACAARYCSRFALARRRDSSFERLNKNKQHPHGYRLYD